MQPQPLAMPTRLVAWSTQRPWLVIGLAVMAAVAGLAWAYVRLEYHTQRGDLHGRDVACEARWRAFVQEFGDDDDCVVIAEGHDRAAMRAALAAVAERLHREPTRFDRVFFRVDLSSLHDRSLLFLPTAELVRIRESLERMRPLLLLGEIGWDRVGVYWMLTHAVTILQRPTLTAADEAELRQVVAVVTALRQRLDGTDYANPWLPIVSRAASGGALGRAADSPADLRQARYFESDDGTLAYLLVRPARQAGSFTPASEAVDRLHAILSEVGGAYPTVTLGLTGLPVLENDEMRASQAGSVQASLLAFLGVSLLYLLAYRGIRCPCLTVATLALGTAWAMGWLTLTVGHLNILSSTFAVMLIGMGDFGVLWVTRYQQERRTGVSVPTALLATAQTAGPSILTAAVSTALAFYATMLADFKAVAELGWIAGSGVLLCALACFTFLPALIVLIDCQPRCWQWWWRRQRRRQQRQREGETASADNATPPGPGPLIVPLPATERVWLPGVAHHPRVTLAVAVAVCVWAGWSAWGVWYDHNLLRLQSRGLPSVVWQEKLLARTTGAGWHAVTYTPSAEEALQLAQRLRALPEVAQVAEVASLIPTEQAEKLPIIRAIADLARCAPDPATIEPFGSDPARLARLIDRNWRTDTALASRWAEYDPTDELGQLRQALVRADPSILREFDTRLARDLAENLRRLHAVARAEPITLADLPAELRQRYVSPTGQWLVRIFAVESLWEYDALRRFVAAVDAVAPQATGKPHGTLEGLTSMKAGFERAGVYALIAIVAILVFDFRRLSYVLAALVPLAMALVVTLGVLGATGLPLNPANLIAFPLIIGVCVDNGVHVLHDFRHRRAGVPYSLGHSTGRAILIAGLTTILGFGTLMVSPHQGMHSLGLVLSLGVSVSLLAGLVVLPALLRLTARSCLTIHRHPALTDSACRRSA
jgi:hopanoid biosynthesis associated RND transporter like protein HpnN